MSTQNKICLYCDPTRINALKCLMEKRAAYYKRARDILLSIYKALEECQVYIRYDIPGFEREFSCFYISYDYKNRKIWAVRKPLHKTHEAYYLSVDLLEAEPSVIVEMELYFVAFLDTILDKQKLD